MGSRSPYPQNGGGRVGFYGKFVAQGHAVMHNGNNHTINYQSDPGQAERHHKDVTSLREQQQHLAINHERERMGAQFERERQAELRRQQMQQAEVNRRRQAQIDSNIRRQLYINQQQLQRQRITEQNLQRRLMFDEQCMRQQGRGRF